MGMAWHVLKCIVYLSICIESNRTVGVGLWKFEIILCIAILRIVEPAGGPVWRHAPLVSWRLI